MRVKFNQLHCCASIILCTCMYRDVSHVQGLTREILIALCADIESRQYRYDLMQNTDKPPQPRSMTTDDIECFFSVLKDSIGKNFTVKQVLFVCTYIMCKVISLALTSHQASLLKLRGHQGEN